MNRKVIIQNLIIFYYLFLSLVAPINGDVGISSHRTMYTNLMKKNLSLFSETEIGFFLSFKESQYSLRRERIEEYCSKRDQKFGKKIVKSSLIYDDVDGVSYCQIAKVASSSWCNHFIKLGKLDLFWSMLGCLTIKYWTNLQWVNKKQSLHFYQNDTKHFLSKCQWQNVQKISWRPSNAGSPVMAASREGMFIW